MKKSLIALAVLASTGAAMAQSSVTLYGRADVNYTWDNISGSGAKYKQASGGLGGSRIGFRGVEDLGNGLKAGFVIENGLNVDDGSASAGGWGGGRQAFVSLAGNFGETRFGRQYTVNDTFSSTYGGAHGTVWGNAATFLTSNGTRNSNAATFISPNFGGLKITGQVATKDEYNFGTTANPDYKAPYALALDYANGPVGLGLTASKNGVVGTKALFQLGGSYDFGAFALIGAWEYDKNKDKENTATIGAKVPLGATTFRVTYNYQQQIGAGSRFLSSIRNADGSAITAAQSAQLRANGGVDSGKVQGLGIGADYKLSKRSTVYAGYSYLKAKNDVFGSGGTTGNGKDSAQQVMVGLDHWF